MAIPGMNKEVRDPLLLHQFVAGLPEPIMKQLRASGEVKTLEAAITRFRLLMTIDSQSVSAVKEVSKEHLELKELTENLALLTEQVASLSTCQSGYRQQKRPRCFNCGQIGHVQRDCRAQTNSQGCYPAQNRLCFTCGQPSHLARNFWHQENEQGTPTQGNGCPRQ